MAQPPCAHILLAVQRLFSCFPAPWAGSAPAQRVFVSVSTPARAAAIARDGFKASSWGPGRSAWARAQDRHSKPRTTRHKFIPDTRRANTLQALPSASLLPQHWRAILGGCWLRSTTPHPYKAGNLDRSGGTRPPPPACAMPLWAGARQHRNTPLLQARCCYRADFPLTAFTTSQVSRTPLMLAPTCLELHQRWKTPAGLMPPAPRAAPGPSAHTGLGLCLFVIPGTDKQPHQTEQHTMVWVPKSQEQDTRAFHDDFELAIPNFGGFLECRYSKVSN